jgi:cell division protein FtsB
MARASVLNTVLFWLMVLLGTAALAPCLVLPAWLERQAQIECLHAREAYLATLQRRLQMLHKQIEHLNDDPAYILRLAQQDFGSALKVPDVETIPIEPGVAPDDATLQPPMPARSPEDEDQLLPDLTVFVEEAMHRYPYAWMYLDEKTRPVLMGLGGILLLNGIILLGLANSRRPAKPRPAA